MDNEILLERVVSLERSFKDVESKLVSLTRSNKEKDIKIKNLQKDNETLKCDLIDLEINLSDLNQYGRRECIEVTNVPESIKQDALEDYILELLKKVGVTINHRDIIAAHRIGPFRRGSNRVVIVKFLHRKDSDKVLKNKRKLKDHPELKRVRIRENLCPSRKRIFNRLYKMLMKDEIDDLWSKNGKIFCIFKDEDDPIIIEHNSDIDYYLSDTPDDTSGLINPVPASTPGSNVVIPVNLTPNAIPATHVNPASHEIPVSNVIPAPSENSVQEVSQVVETDDDDDFWGSEDTSYENLVNLNHVGTNWAEWARQDGNLYIGRKSEKLPGISGDWGNKFIPKNFNSMKDRKVCSEQYEEYITTERHDLIERLHELDGKSLGCYCAPLKYCHGEVLLKLRKIQKEKELLLNQSIASDKVICPAVKPGISLEFSSPMLSKKLISSASKSIVIDQRRFSTNTLESDDEAEISEAEISNEINIPSTQDAMMAEINNLTTETIVVSPHHANISPPMITHAYVNLSPKSKSRVSIRGVRKSR